MTTNAVTFGRVHRMAVMAGKWELQWYRSDMGDLMASYSRSLTRAQNGGNSLPLDAGEDFKLYVDKHGNTLQRVNGAYGYYRNRSGTYRIRTLGRLMDVALSDRYGAGQYVT